jgi:hypothetical protein
VGTGNLIRKPSDPLLADDELSLACTYYPLGFSVNVRTNSRDVLAAASEAWGMWLPEFDNDPIDLRIAVQEQGALAPEPAYRRQDHLLSAVSDHDNYAVLDLERLFAYAFFSRKTVSDRAWFRWYFLDTMGLFLLAQRHVTAVHAATVARDGRGIALCGKPAAGKSTLAWACARAGWTYVSDDATWLLTEGAGRSALGRWHQVRFRHDAPLLFPELDGYVSRVRPNGKLSIEVPTSEFPFVHTTPRCEIHAAVFLDRTGTHPAGFVRMPAREAAEAMLSEYGPLYREEVLVGYRAVVDRLLQAPAYRLRYKSLGEGIELLGKLHAGLGPA